MKWRQFCRLAALMAVVAGCGDDKVVGSGDDRALSIVQDGNFTGHDDYTVGQAAACFFENPKWTSLKAEDGSNYVNLTGGMTFAGEPVEALIQFRVDKDAGTFVINAFEIDDAPQDDALKLSLIEAMYGEDGCG